MTEHPAAPTTEAGRKALGIIEAGVNTRWKGLAAYNWSVSAYAASRVVAIEDEARAAARKEVDDALRPALNEAHQYAGASYFAGAAVRKVIRILDSLSTDTREDEQP